MRNPIDAFVLAKLEAAGLTPAPEADRRTLARRLSLDLTGLPPTPSCVEAFVNDKSADAYETARRSAAGHRRSGASTAAATGSTPPAMPTRTASTSTTTARSGRTATGSSTPSTRTCRSISSRSSSWPATCCRIATLDQKIAHRLQPLQHHDQRRRHHRRRVPGALRPRPHGDDFGQVWLGLTAGCAVCHDHKFDPLTQKEFYSLSAFFNNTTQAAMDGNIKDTPPIVIVPPQADRPRWDALQARSPPLASKLDDRKREAAARVRHSGWRASSRTISQAYVPHDGLVLRAPLNEGEGKSITVTVDGAARDRSTATRRSLGPTAAMPSKRRCRCKRRRPSNSPDVGDFEADQAFSTSIWVKLGRRNQTGAIVARMDNKADYRGWDLWVEGDKVGTHIINKWPDDALKVVCADAAQARTSGRTSASPTTAPGKRPA